ncbi:MAG: sugar phosphate isomerase/epimerase [Phycisphaerae bacterium]|nr:sugar phosphate isomerase/epimerase [Phycisphaerae bacterium]
MVSEFKRLTRRDFIKESILTSAVLAGGLQTGALAAAGAASTPGSKMKLGLVTYLWGQDWDLPTLIANCRKTGFRGVELRVDHAHKVSPKLTADERKAVKQQFLDSKVTLVGMGTNWEFHSPDPAKLRANIDGAKADVVLSHDCGGTGVKVKPNALPKEVSVAKTCEQIGQSLNEVGRFARGYDQEIRVEVHGSKTSELPIMKQIFDHVTEKNVTVCWNCNEQDLIGDGLAANFNLVKNRLGSITHCREFNIGDYPYQQLMDLFVAMDYQGWVLLEARTKPKDRIAALIEQRQVFEQMVKKAQAKL